MSECEENIRHNDNKTVNDLCKENTEICYNPKWKTNRLAGLVETYGEARDGEQQTLNDQETPPRLVVNDKDVDDNQVTLPAVENEAADDVNTIRDRRHNTNHKRDLEGLASVIVRKEQGYSSIEVLSRIVLCLVVIPIMGWLVHEIQIHEHRFEEFERRSVLPKQDIFYAFEKLINDVPTLAHEIKDLKERSQFLSTEILDKLEIAGANISAITESIERLGFTSKNRNNINRKHTQTGGRIKTWIDEIIVTKRLRQQIRKEIYITKSDIIKTNQTLVGLMKDIERLDIKHAEVETDIRIITFCCRFGFGVIVILILCMCISAYLITEHINTFKNYNKIIKNHSKTLSNHSNTIEHHDNMILKNSITMVEHNNAIVNHQTILLSIMNYQNY